MILFVLVYKANKQIYMAVKTPTGLTERQTLENIVLQGDTWGSILASVQVDSIGKECVEAGYGYKYKDSLPISMFGLVDDTIGVTEAGFMAQQMNAFINVKTAEKSLQFGPKKCKSMLIGKNTENVINNPLKVDNWTVEYVENEDTEELDLKETFEGQVTLEQVTEQKYLGFVVSSFGNNMANIQQMKKKSIGIIRQIFSRLESLSLNKYYFECALIFMKCMLRGSILYAAECYYNLKETELRQLERIEEGFLRQLLNTTKGCPISQLYMSVGLIPARYEIMKIRLLFFKYILNQEESSMIKQFFKLQLGQPTRGDWASSCLSNLHHLQINESLEEIEQMSKNQFKRILSNRIDEKAFEYLNVKRGSKGSQIIYEQIKMCEYLLPSDEILSISDKRNIFSVRNRMVNISYNFPKQQQIEKCVCGEIENMEHIYLCEILNRDKIKMTYNLIYNGTLKQQVEVYKRFERSFENRQTIKANSKDENEIYKETKPHEIPKRDPLSSVSLENSNG